MLLPRRPMLSLALCLMILISGGVLARAAMAQQQEEPEVESEAPFEFVSGTITEIPPGKIVINRAIPGKTPELRTFVIAPETKVEGRLKVRARVTVGFKATDESEPVAVRVIVRPYAQSHRK